jgi:hypothetical protein
MFSDNHIIGITGTGEAGLRAQRASYSNTLNLTVNNPILRRHLAQDTEPSASDAHSWLLPSVFPSSLMRVVNLNILFLRIASQPAKGNTLWMLFMAIPLVPLRRR